MMYPSMSDPAPRPLPNQRPPEWLAFILALGMMLVFGAATYALVAIGGAR
jgi:hypothetical protein